MSGLSRTWPGRYWAMRNDSARWLPGGMRPRHGAKIWLLVTLEAWLRTVFAK